MMIKADRKIIKL